jgi:HSP20 family molecular chaperone IbpA
MNRFGSGYDDLFESFGVGPEDAREPGADEAADDAAERGTPESADRDESADALADFLAAAAEAAEAAGRRGRGAEGGRLGADRGVRGRTPTMGAPADIVEVAEGLLIVFDLPGVSEADVELAAAPRAIRLRAARRLPMPPGATAMRRERSAGAIERIIPVPPGFDSGSLEARLAAGVLAVMVPRREASESEGGDSQGGTGLWNDG